MKQLTCAPFILIGMNPVHPGVETKKVSILREAARARPLRGSSVACLATPVQVPVDQVPAAAIAPVPAPAVTAAVVPVPVPVAPAPVRAEADDNL